jgi:uncharacterized membrane protein YqjE
MHDQNNMSGSPSSGSAAVAIADNIARTVDRTALRKVRHLVDNVEREERSAHNRAILMFAGLLLVLAAIAVPTLSHLKQSGYWANRQMDCIATETAKQETALRLDIIRDQPGISADQLEARLESFRPTIKFAVNKSCSKARR